MTRAFSPMNLEEAIRILQDEPEAVPIAGCTDLMVVDEATGREHETVVNILGLPELTGIAEDGEFIDIGAACTFTGLRDDPLVADHARILVEAAATVGGWQIQNRGTLGGNIANASPAGDSLPALLALDATLLVVGSGGERSIPYSEFHTGYRETALQPGELIVRVRVRKHDGPATFRKVGTRQAQAISKVVVAFTARRTSDSLSDVRVAAGSVAPTPIRLGGVEDVLEGQVVSGALADAAGTAAESAVSPIDDVRSTADYRRHVLGRVVRRMILETAAS